MAQLLDIHIVIRYRADDGYEATKTIGSPGDAPAGVLHAAALELATVADAFGFGERVEQGISDGRQLARNTRDTLDAGSRRERAVLLNQQA